ncbi:Na+/H+ antiporter NhaA type [Candidatus Rhodobacter oscarellae]|uniref:Na(+)/H(+) antiporter NhaA n=1 Tax=Candidatus Rhodobacter oscarellae TaxID=1675527 RepID=A0A0J9E687_9RHOB|nr:Na+/H+ antiporter NhaA [Candidatus Rhodobacter lobularis]KMW58285.1 Na+/H+ antiporter NhaA type [Candidatus Rhodobacter lobularis]
MAQDITLGTADAKVSLHWFVDYTSKPARRIRDVMMRTAERFPTEDVCLTLRFLPGSAPGAQEAARAVIAAQGQGKAFDLHRALFERGRALDMHAIEAAAAELGLDVAQLRADMASEATDAVLADHRAEATAGHINAAPALFVDGRHYEGAWDEDSLIEAATKPLGYRWRLASSDFFEWAASAGMVLILATLAALVAVNIGLHHWYEELKHLKIGISIGEGGLNLPFEAWVNDGLMALFFLVVGIEIKREIVDGELSDMSRAALPIIGAIGGMLVPALIYVAVNWGGPGAGGWGVPMATDIAFTLGIMALLGSRVPTSLKVFVSALAIADDLGAIVVIALFYGHGFDGHALLLAGVVLVVMAGLNLARVYSRLPYLLLGVVLWYYVHESGLHATVAGVLTAAAIPSRRGANLAGVAAQTAAVFQAELEAASGSSRGIGNRAFEVLEGAMDRLREPGLHLQHALERWSNFLILPLFAFLNTGIVLVGMSFDLFAPEALGVILGLLVGKPLGIALAVWIAVRLGLARLSAEISWMQIIGAGALCGVGFTMSIFIGSAAFDGSTLDTVKLAILIASALSGVLGAALLWVAGRPAR